MPAASATLCANPIDPAGSLFASNVGFWSIVYWLGETADAWRGNKGRKTLLISSPAEPRHIAHAYDKEQAEVLLTRWGATGSKLMDSLDLPSVANLQAISTAVEDAGTSVASPERSRPRLTFADAIKDITATIETVEKAAAAQLFFESYYQDLLRRTPARELRLQVLEQEIEQQKVPPERQERIRDAFWASESAHLRDRRARVGASSFTHIQVIGHGAYGVVSLVREKQSQQLYAMKRIRKSDMLLRGQEGHIRAERDFLQAASSSTQWIVRLFCSFQDIDHLYLVQEYCAGGDLLSFLIAQDKVTEQTARQLAAEMVMAIAEVHKLGFIHRDIKPDNFLVERGGHLRLADFGLATALQAEHSGVFYEDVRRRLMKKHNIEVAEPARHAARSRRMMREDEPGSILTKRARLRRRYARSHVGTGNYISPEVLIGAPYDQAVDWYPPFDSKTRGMTRYRIINWRNYLHFPSNQTLSNEVAALIRQLLCDRDQRLRNAKTIAGHAWFAEIEWSTLHQQEGACRPDLQSEADTKHFGDFADNLEPLPQPDGKPETKDPVLRSEKGFEVLQLRKKNAFAGYTFKRIKRGVYDSKWSFPSEAGTPTRNALLLSMTS